MSSDIAQPSTSCICSFDVIVTTTFCAVISVIEYFTSGFGASLSIFVIFIVTVALFPAKSFTSITSPLSVVLFSYSFVRLILSSDIVQPSTSCISSFALIVTVTFLFVNSSVEYIVSNTGGILSVSSKLNASLFVIFSFCKLSSAYIHKYHSPSPESFVILCPFSKVSVKLSLVGSSILWVHWYLKVLSFTPTSSKLSFTSTVTLYDFWLSSPFSGVKVAVGPSLSNTYFFPAFSA